MRSFCEKLLMDMGRGNYEHLWARYGAIWDDIHEASDLQVKLIDLFMVDLHVNEAPDINVGPGWNPGVGKMPRIG